MKKGILILALALCGGGAMAQGLQPDYYVEVGAYGGIAPFTNPRLAHERGDKVMLPAVWGFDVHYNLTDAWQIGIQTTASSWKGTGSVIIDSLRNRPLGTADVDYQYADHAWTITGRLNHVIPHYDDYRINRSNFYYGIAFGVAFTLSDGAVAYSQFHQNAGEQYRYLSRYNYESGAGYVFGLQAGYNFFFSQHIGFNAEFAPRFTHISGLDMRNQSRNSQFETFTFPIMIGLRVRF